MSENKPLVLNKTLAAFFPEGEIKVELTVKDGKVTFNGGGASGSFTSVEAKVDVDGTVVDVTAGKFEVSIVEGVIKTLKPVVAKPAAEKKADKANTSTEPVARRSGASAHPRAGQSLHA